MGLEPGAPGEIFDRLRLGVYRLLKGQNSVYGEPVFPTDEPQENLRDLAARMDALQQPSTRSGRTLACRSSPRNPDRCWVGTFSR